jgi:hypothetical protein
MTVIRLWNSPFDPADASANRLNATFPQRWSDPAGPEVLWCSVPSGSALVRLVATVHFLCMLPFLIALTPPIGALAAWLSTRKAASGDAKRAAAAPSTPPTNAASREDETIYVG